MKVASRTDNGPGFPGGLQKESFGVAMSKGVNEESWKGRKKPTTAAMYCLITKCCCHDDREAKRPASQVSPSTNSLTQARFRCLKRCDVESACRRRIQQTLSLPLSAEMASACCQLPKLPETEGLE